MNKSPSHPPSKRRDSTSLDIRQGITDKTEVWTMPKGMLPQHPRYHPTWLFYKWHDDKSFALNEYLVYKIFEKIAPDLCPTVFLVNENRTLASLMRWVGGSIAAAKKAAVDYYFEPNKQQAKDLAAIMVVDTLTTNYDRHSGNMLAHKGRLIPIDHGLAFGSKILRPDITDRFHQRMPKKHMAAWRTSARAGLDAVDANVRALVRLVNEGLAGNGGRRKRVSAKEILSWTAIARRKVTTT